MNVKSNAGFEVVNNTFINFRHILRLSEETYVSPRMFNLFYIPERAKHFPKDANRMEGQTCIGHLMTESRNYDHLH